MGINEINAYFNNNNNSLNFLHRTLSVPSTNKKNSFLNYFVNFGVDLAMIISPLITYCFQIYKFNKTKSSKGFSKFLCFLLFMGNILRIFFWFGTHFKITLLYQSIGVVIFQIILIHLCVKYQDDPTESSLLPTMKTINVNQQENNITSEKTLLYYLLHWKNTFNLKEIWKWRAEIEYYKFMSFIVFIIFSLCLILINNKIFIHSLGILSAIFESLCCVPQVIENYKTKNSKNVSFSMVFCWFLGDSFRLYYNIKYKSPLQMITAISIQVTMDLTVCIQLCIYSDKKSKDRFKFNLRKKKHIKEINKIIKKIDELNISDRKKGTHDNFKLELNKKQKLEDEEKNDQNDPKLDQTNISAL